MKKNDVDFEEEIDLIELFFILWSQKLKIIGITIIFAGLSIFYALNLPNIYTASVIFLPPKNDQGSKLNSMMSSLSAIPFFPGIGGKGGENSFDVLEAYLYKYENLWKVIDKFSLKNHYEIGSEHKIDVENIYKKKLKITKDKTSGILKLDFSDEDPQLAADIANFNVRLLSKISLNTVLSENKKKRAFISKRLETSKKELKNIEDRIRDYEKENKILAIESQVKATIEASTKLQSEIQLNLMKIKVQSELGANETHPEIRLLRLQNIELYKQLDAVRNGGLILSDESKNNKNPMNYIPLYKIPQMKLDLERLMRKKVIELEVYKVLTKEMEMVKIENSKEQDLIEVIEWARVPEKKSEPSRAIICVTITIFGFLISCFFILIRNAFDEKKLRQQNV